MPGERLLLENGLHLRTQTIETTPHVGHAGGDPNPGSRAQFDHLRKLSRIDLNNAGSAPLSTLINALPGNSMWIAPTVGCCCSAAGSRISASHADDTVTGSKAVAEAAGSANSPLLNARRHANTWLAFTPCARATNATLAPGSNVSSTMRRFSATERHLRTRRSTPSV